MWEDNIKVDLNEMECKVVNLIDLGQDRVQCLAVFKIPIVMNICVS
jgi:hypothetical protein